MCAGCGSGLKAASVQAASSPDLAASAPTVGQDTTVFTVAYFNGTTEEVVGMDEVYRRVIDPSSRAAGTDEHGLQGATYAPKR